MEQLLNLKKRGGAFQDYCKSYFMHFGYYIGNCCPRIIWNMICALFLWLGRGRVGGGGGGLASKTLIYSIS